jgi:hypothetical protein
LPTSRNPVVELAPTRTICLLLISLPSAPPEGSDRRGSSGKEIIASIHAAAVTALKRPDIAKRMQELGLTAIGDQPDEFAEFIKTDIEKWRKIVRQKGLTAD